MQIWSSYFSESQIFIIRYSRLLGNTPFSISYHQQNVNMRTAPKTKVKVKSCTRSGECPSCVSLAWRQVSVYMCWPNQHTWWRNNSWGATNRRPEGRMQPGGHPLRTAALEPLGLQPIEQRFNTELPPISLSDALEPPSMTSPKGSIAPANVVPLCHQVDGPCQCPLCSYAGYICNTVCSYIVSPGRCPSWNAEMCFFYLLAVRLTAAPLSASTAREHQFFAFLAFRSFLPNSSWTGTAVTSVTVFILNKSEQLFCSANSLFFAVIAHSLPFWTLWQTMSSVSPHLLHCAQNYVHTGCWAWFLWPLIWLQFWCPF